MKSRQSWTDDGLTMFFAETIADNVQGLDLTPVLFVDDVFRDKDSLDFKGFY